MKVLSLFDGISCGRIALDRAEITVSRYVASEIDKSAIKISLANWKDIERKGSVQNLNFAQGEFDLLIGGSPCQGLSRANSQRLNLEDSRSGLFFLNFKNQKASKAEVVFA
jgi:DNA (cytosine-5)-methyltransferase 3A